ncbi:hypothetical protein ACGF3G_24435 [Streptomyces sp. NPDC048179]|uniref:hypothetical protein n=1 Tax=Streptomyces sp. NPDC048179 TaxID=3365506 RepID=UPI003721BD95
MSRDPADLRLRGGRQGKQRRELLRHGRPDPSRCHAVLVLALGHTPEQRQNVRRAVAGRRDPGQERHGLRTGRVDGPLVQNALVELRQRLLGIRAGQGPQQIGHRVTRL